MTIKYFNISQLSEGDKQLTIKVAINIKGKTEDYNTTKDVDKLLKFFFLIIKLLKLILIDREVKIFNLLVRVILI